MAEKQVSFSRRIESLDDNNSKIPPVMREVLKEISALCARLDAQGIKLSVAVDFGETVNPQQVVANVGNDERAFVRAMMAFCSTAREAFDLEIFGVMRKDGHVERLGETSEKACASLFAAAFSMQAVLVEMDGEIQQ